jgi:hypothetical protein
LVIKKLIIDDFYFVGHFNNNIIIDGAEKAQQTKKIYQHHSIGNYIVMYSISPIKRQFVIPSVIEFMLPMELTLR